MQAQLGDRAPAFTLAASTEEKISIDEYRGDAPIVLLFFPLAFSPVCTSELITVRDDFKSFERLGARVLAVSVDSQYTLRAWAQQLELPFALLSDFNKEASRQYGVLYEDFHGMKGVSKRAAFVIGTDGHVLYRWVSEDAGQLPDFEAIKGALTLASTS